MRAEWCEHEYQRCPNECPLRSAEGRLREAHRHWHDCARYYQEPEDFRGSLNASIQALRNVTFALQKVKSKLPGFESWYAAEQEKMKSDPVLRWSHRARNTIVKEGDLVTLSKLRVSLVANYESEADSVADEQLIWGQKPNIDFGSQTAAAEAPPILTIEEIFDELHSWDIPLSVRHRSTVLLERRWVDRNISDHELLALLSYAYGRMNSLVTKAHELIGMHAVRVLVPEVTDEYPALPKVEYVEDLPLDGRLPCMASTRHLRTKRLRMSNAESVEEFRSWTVRYDHELATAVRESAIYGTAPDYPANEIGGWQTNAQLAKAVRFYARLAEGILRSGQDHGWFSYFLRDGRNVGARVHVTTDTQGKHAIAAEIARTALETDADAVLTVSEAWMSPMQETPDGSYVPPGLHPDRTEAILVSAVSKSGATASGSVPFRTTAGEPPSRQVEIGEYQANDIPSGLLLATLAAWGVREKPITGEVFWRAQRTSRNNDKP